MTEREPSQENRAWPAQLRDMMAAVFSLDELRTLCFALQLDYDELEGASKSARIASLIRLLTGRGRIDDLLDKCETMRSEEAWLPLREAFASQPELTLDPDIEWSARLRDRIATHFTLAEVEKLALDLGADYEELGEGGKSHKIMALIGRLADRGDVVALVERCQALREHVDWSALRDTAAQHPERFTVPAETPGDTYHFAGDFRGANITIVSAAEVRDIESLPPEPGDPPYKGLQYFDESDAGHFFGREKLTAQVVGRLAQTRFLTVIGASGSGKSSLVRAGVIPALRRGQRMADGSLPPTDSGKWHIIVMTPSAHPLDALAAALLPDTESLTAVAELQGALAQNPRALTLATRTLLARKSRPYLLLVIDQFEEVFTLCRQPVERQAFIDNLVTAVDPENGAGITVLLTLRADFYARCAEHDDLRQLVSKSQEYIGAMSREELAQAILRPAALGDWRLQEGLVEQMLDDVGGEPGALPLLSHALLETWSRRRGRTLTLSGYRESGGVRGAIAQTAETIFRQRLTVEQRAIARMIFVRLTEVGESEDGKTPDTRRRANFSELITRATDPGTLNVVLDILTDARLITTDLIPPDETQVVEVAHEALIREWPTLRHWLDQDRTNLIHHRQLTADVADWLKLDRDPGALYRGARLEQILAWVEAFPDPLNVEEQAFLDASREVEADEVAQRQRLARARRTQRILYGVAGVMVVVIVAVVAYFGTRPDAVADCIPQIMTGNFNVAVAEMAVLDDNGNLVNGENRAGQQLAARIEAILNDAFSASGASGADDIQVWAEGPALFAEHCAQIGVVADDLAGVTSPISATETVNADVVIYGTLRPVAGRAELAVEFYVAPQFGQDSGNIVGTYAFEKTVPVFDITDPGSEVDAALAPQVTAMAHIARGFTAEVLGQPERALSDFEAAADVMPSADFAHFFVGQEYLFLAQTDTDQAVQYLESAAVAFERAPENARAQIGLGAVHFVRAQNRLNAALDDDFSGDQVAALADVQTEAEQALVCFEAVVAGGNQIEVYGVPVDQIARLGQGIALRVSGEVAYYQNDAEAAATTVDAAIAVLEAAAPALEVTNDHRLLSQVYQALGSVYEWRGFLLGEQDAVDASAAAITQARDYYEQCLSLGETFPFDTYMVEEIVEKLCRPRYDLLANQ